MAYASYSDYLGDYGGSRLTEAEFAHYAAAAESYLEVLTFGRCVGVFTPKLVRAVKLSCCAVADELCRQEREPPLRSQSVGQWSRTYADQRSSERCIADVARIYLRGTGLLWRGWKKAVYTDAE
ncbi:MAG: hypothetical protein RSF82_03930 [Angelakisella sp.]